MLADGEIAQYPMLTFALATIAENHPDAIHDIGFFGLPGDDAAKNCATIWMPAAMYIAKTRPAPGCQEVPGVHRVVEGTEAMTAAVAPTGPYVIKGATLPDDVLPAVLDIQTYLDNDAGTRPSSSSRRSRARRSRSSRSRSAPVSSPQRKAAEAYDQDVEKQAKQLGLPGWE